MSKSVTIRFPDDLEQAVNELKGDVTFSAWVKRAVIQRVERETGNTDTAALETKQGRPQVATESIQTGKQRTTFDQRVELVRECYSNGLDYKQTAAWLNEKGYLPQRGTEFTPNSVRGIAKHLKD